MTKPQIIEQFIYRCCIYFGIKERKRLLCGKIPLPDNQGVQPMKIRLSDPIKFFRNWLNFVLSNFGMLQLVCVFQCFANISCLICEIDIDYFRSKEIIYLGRIQIKLAKMPNHIKASNTHLRKNSNIFLFTLKNKVPIKYMLRHRKQILQQKTNRKHAASHWFVIANILNNFTLQYFCDLSWKYSIQVLLCYMATKKDRKVETCIEIICARRSHVHVTGL